RSILLRLKANGGSMLKADKYKKRIESWEDLANLVEHFSFYSAQAWLFRGVTDVSHALVPKVGRPGARAKKTYIKADKSRRTEQLQYRLEDERAVFDMFKQQARSHMHLEPVTDLEWLAVAQHFGLPTRLLDWTESLLVAAWFAVERSGAKED